MNRWELDQIDNEIAEELDRDWERRLREREQAQYEVQNLWNTPMVMTGDQLVAVGR